MLFGITACAPVERNPVELTTQELTNTPIMDFATEQVESDELGEAALDGMLFDYSAEFRFEISTTEVIKDFLEDACQCDLTDMFEQWVYEQ